MAEVEPGILFKWGALPAGKTQETLWAAAQRLSGGREGGGRWPRLLEEDLVASDAVELVDTALLAILHFLFILTLPPHPLRERWRRPVACWMDQIQGLAGQPGVQSFVQVLAILRAGGLECSASAAWGDWREERIAAQRTARQYPLCDLADVKKILKIDGQQSDDELRGMIREASGAIADYADRTPLRQRYSTTFSVGPGPLPSESSRVTIGRFEGCRLTFWREGSPTLGVAMKWGGEHSRRQYRTPLKRKVMQLLHRSHIDRRVYLPEFQGPPSDRDLQTALEDARALILLYLVQDGLVDLDQDEAISKSLSDYLASYGRAVDEEDRGVLLHDLLRKYRVPEDYRAFRRYVAQCGRGLRSDRRRNAGAGDHPLGIGIDSMATVNDAACEIGTSRRELYRLIHVRKVRTHRQPHGGRFVISSAEIERLRRDRHDRHVRSQLVEKLARKKGIKKESARRWVERQLARGLSLIQILQQLDLKPRD